MRRKEKRWSTWQSLKSFEEILAKFSCHCEGHQVLLMLSLPSQQYFFVSNVIFSLVLLSRRWKRAKTFLKFHLKYLNNSDCRADKKWNKNAWDRFVELSRDVFKVVIENRNTNLTSSSNLHFSTQFHFTQKCFAIKSKKFSLAQNNFSSFIWFWGGFVEKAVGGWNLAMPCP